MDKLNRGIIFKPQISMMYIDELSVIGKIAASLQTQIKTFHLQNLSEFLKEAS